MPERVRNSSITSRSGARSRPYAISVALIQAMRVFPSDELVSSFAQSDHVVTGAMRVRTSEAQWNAIPLIPPLPAHDWLRKGLTPMRFRWYERLLLPVTPHSVPGRHR